MTDSLRVGDRVRLIPTARIRQRHPDLLGTVYAVTEVRRDGVMLDEWLIVDEHDLTIVVKETA